MYFRPDGKLDGMILTHVDDMLHGSGGEEFENVVMNTLKKRFMFGKEEESTFRYTGMQVFQRADSIVINQDHYIESLEVPNINQLGDDLNGDSILSVENQDVFRSIVGQIGWISNTSRPDLCFDKMVLSTKVGKATVKDFKQAIKIIKKLKSETTEMKFPNLGHVEDWTLEGHGDAGYKSLPDKISSCGGQVVMICNKKKELKCVVSWRCRKLRRIVSSSTAAEALSSNDTLDELVYVKHVLKELLGDKANMIHGASH